MNIQIDLRRPDFEAMHPTAKLLNFNGETKVYFGDGSQEINSQWITWCACIGMQYFEAEQSQKVAVPDTNTAVVLALENVQTEVSHSSFVTMDADNESEIYAVDATKLSKYIDDLIKAQEQVG